MCRRVSKCSYKWGFMEAKARVLIKSLTEPLIRQCQSDDSYLFQKSDHMNASYI